MRNNTVYEIELKVHVEEPGSLKALLDRSCEFRESYDKYDVYYAYPRGQARERADKTFRVRKNGDSCAVTIKEKRLEGGIETNLEKEFTVSSWELFTWFIEDLGCARKIVKIKRGDLYAMGDINLELSLVEGLGWFLEVEKLVSADDPAQHEAARREILAVLGKLGIREDRIEPRYYTDMLAGLRPR